MEKDFIQSVIFLIGGGMAPGENMKRYLARVSLHSGVSFSCVRAAFYEGRYSEETKAKFEKAAQSVGQSHDVITYLKRKLIVWERHPERYGRVIDGARTFLVLLAEASGEVGNEPVLLRRGDDSGRSAAPAAGGLADAAAART